MPLGRVLISPVLDAALEGTSMRDLTDLELEYVCGGLDDSDEDIIVTGHNPSYPPPYYGGGGGLYPSYPPPPYGGGGGGGGSPAPAPSPLNALLATYTKVTIGHHDIYLPPTMTPQEQLAANSFLDGIRAEDAKINNLGDNEQINITETWTDASGLTHTQGYTETGADLKAQWNASSFSLFSSTDYTSTLNGAGTNGTGRGASSVGSDPNMAGNNLVGYNLSTVQAYYGSNGLAAMEYLALHEVAHNTYAGQLSNSYTGTKDDSIVAGTPNHANEDLANTIALATMRELGLSLGNYTNPATVGNGWQTGDTWGVPAPPPDVDIPGLPGGGYGGDPYQS